MILDASLLPRSLWEADGTERPRLCLPSSLAAAYRHVLANHSLLELRLAGDAVSPIGGVGDAEANDHFARRFDGACGRLMLALLDPEAGLRGTSDRLVRLLAGGRVHLLDVPSGAGTASLALLSTLAELRAQRVLPRLPLHVRVTAGEISDRATALALEMVGLIRPVLLEQAIYLEYEAHRWNAERDTETVAIVNCLLAVAGRDDLAQPCARLGVLSAFSGHLEEAAMRCQDRLGLIFSVAKENEWPFLWIEPPVSNHARRQGWLARLWKFVKQRLGWSTSDVVILSTAARMADPLDTGRCCSVRADVAWLDEAWHTPGGTEAADAA